LDELAIEHNFFDLVEISPPLDEEPANVPFELEPPLLPAPTDPVDVAPV
jgi:hypothetical protein